MIRFPGGTERGGAGRRHATPNGMQFKTYALFISGLFRG